MSPAPPRAPKTTTYTRYCQTVFCISERDRQDAPLSLNRARHSRFTTVLRVAVPFLAPCHARMSAVLVGGGVAMLLYAKWRERQYLPIRTSTAVEGTGALHS